MRAALTAWLSVAALAGALGPTDLSEVLAQPLDSEFTDTGGAAFLTGGFDAHRYAAWLAPNSADVKPIEDTLLAEGLVRGYARSWSEPVHAEVDVGSSHVQYLIEVVEEFRTEGGAKMRLDGTRSYAMTGHGFEKAIDTTIPAAWAAVVDAGYSIAYEVSFRKGNDVYFVVMDSAVNDMTEKVLMQANSQFEKAPASTIPPDGSQTPGTLSFPPATVSHGLLVAGGVVIGAVVVITLLVLLALIFRKPGRWQPHGVPPQGAYLSPDGAYWWDGAAWNPTNPGGSPNA